MMDISIQDLLVMAYREQRVDRRAVRLVDMVGAPAPLRAAGGALFDLGVRVDSSPAQAVLLSDSIDSMGAMMVDLLAVHDAVLSLDDFWLEWGKAGEVTMWDHASLAENGFEVVTRGDNVLLVDCTAGDGLPLRPVRQVNTSITIILHAREATVPEAFTSEVRPRGRQARGGYDGRGRPRNQANVRWADVDLARAEYLVWRSALLVLRELLSGHLTEFSLTDELPDDMPWKSRRVSAESAVQNQ